MERGCRPLRCFLTRHDEQGWRLDGNERLMGGTGADGWEFMSPWGKHVADCAHDKLKTFSTWRLMGVVLPWVICLYLGFGLDGALVSELLLEREGQEAARVTAGD